MLTRPLRKPFSCVNSPSCSHQIHFSLYSFSCTLCTCCTSNFECRTTGGNAYFGLAYIIRTHRSLSWIFEIREFLKPFFSLILYTRLLAYYSIIIFSTRTGGLVRIWVKITCTKCLYSFFSYFLTQPQTFLLYASKKFIIFYYRNDDKILIFICLQFFFPGIKKDDKITRSRKGLKNNKSPNYVFRLLISYVEGAVRNCCTRK